MLVGAVGIEPTTFGLKGKRSALQQTTANYKDQRNQQKQSRTLGWFRLELYPVHGNFTETFWRRSAVTFTPQPVKPFNHFAMWTNRGRRRWYIARQGVAGHMESDACVAIEQVGSLDQLINDRLWAVFHGQFQRERLRGLLAGAPRISTKPRCLTTVRTGVFFNRTVSRLLSSEVGTASCTRSARERATATCTALAPRKWTLILVVALTPSKTPKFGGLNPPKHAHLQSKGSSELEMHPQPFLHSHEHSPAPHFAIVRPQSAIRKRYVRLASIFKKNQTAQNASFRLVHDRSEIRRAARLVGASASKADVPLHPVGFTRVVASFRNGFRVSRSSENAA
jgi:hypothetical protein